MNVEHSELRKHELPPHKTTICVVGGDGVGPDVTDAAAEVLAALGLGLNFTTANAGLDCFNKTENAIPDKTLADVEHAGIALFGAITSPTQEKVEGYRSPILVLRKTFGL